MTDKKTTEKKETETETAATFTEELTAVLEEIKEEPVKEKKKGEIVTIVNETDIQIGEREYRIVKNHRDAFDPERLGERFSEVLARYDYIVGDWGYEQLRLRGFFDTSNRRAAPDQRIDTLEDYLYEYCNFGCAYFVIERTGERKEKTTHRRRRHKKNNRSNAFVEEKSAPANKNSKLVIRTRKEENKKTTTPKQPSPKKSGKGFTIRQREE